MSTFVVCPIIAATMLSCTLLSLLVLLLSGGVVSQSDGGGGDRYVYLIYYDSDNCRSDAVAVKGFVSGDNFTATGASDVGGSGRCALETLCILNGSSDQCLELEPTVVARANYTVSGDGTILECDTSNSELDTPECSIKEKQACEQSSVFPSCYFNVVLGSDLISSTDLLKNNHTDVDPLDDQLVAVYYSGSDCASFAGLQSMVVGDVMLAATTDAVSCDDAIACAVEPLGKTCQSLRNGEITATIDYDSATGTYSVCGPSGCDDVDPTACVPSPIHPSCHYKLVPGRRFYSSPQDFLLPGVEPEETQEYGYMIYYDADDCSTQTVAVRGFVPGEGLFLPSDSRSNDTCASEAVCMLSRRSRQCQALDPNATSVNATFTLQSDGSIQKCDNLQPSNFECFIVPPCKASDLYPECHWTAVSKSELVQNPNLIQNTVGGTGVADTVYLLYYSDGQCQNFEGMHGNPSGRFNLTLTSNATSCNAAMACLLSPNGDACEAVNPAGVIEVSLGTGNGGRVASGCDDEGNCRDWSPDDCIVSTIHPACHHRIVTAIRLFGNSSSYIPRAEPPPTPSPGPGASPGPGSTSTPASAATNLVYSLVGLLCALPLFTAAVCGAM